jgi:hypothetical protein
MLARSFVLDMGFDFNPSISSSNNGIRSGAGVVVLKPGCSLVRPLSCFSKASRCRRIVSRPCWRPCSLSTTTVPLKKSTSVLSRAFPCTTPDTGDWRFGGCSSYTPRRFEKGSCWRSRGGVGRFGGWRVVGRGRHCPFSKTRTRRRCAGRLSGACGERRIGEEADIGGNGDR